VDEEANQEYIQDVALELVRREPSLSQADAQAISQVLLRSTVAVIDALLVAKPREAKKMFAMLKSMHVAFLAQWFDS
jgi:predicted house-cleaning NTP pyrophosphatase (Maf/HAM1 superfamily)